MHPAGESASPPPGEKPREMNRSSSFRLLRGAWKGHQGQGGAPSNSESGGGVKRTRSVTKQESVTDDNELIGSDGLLEQYGLADGLDDDQKNSEGGRLRFWRAWFYPDLPWGAPPNWKENQPGRRFLVFWEILTMMGCIYVAVTVPYKLGFTDTLGAVEEGCSFSFYEVSDPDALLHLTDLMCDAVFVLDLIFNFFIARWVISTEGTPHWVIVDDLTRLSAMYVFKGTFCFDLVGIIPWQLMTCFSSDAPASLKVLDSVRLIKLLRLYRIKRVIAGLYIRFPQSIWMVATTELLMTMSLVAHWMACLWYRIGLGLFGSDTEHGWVFKEGIVDDQGLPVDGQGITFFAWVSAFYWSITTMSTIGYGDISASTQEERMVACALMVIGCVFFAYTTGTITNIITGTTHSSKVFKDKIEELTQFLDARDVPVLQKSKIHAYYMTRFPTMRVFDEERILNDLPMGLRVEVSRHLWSDLIDSDTGVPIFRLVNESCKEDICSRLQTTHCSSDSVVDSGTSNPLDKCLWIIRSGKVRIFEQGRFLDELQHFDIFGENVIFGLQNTARRAISSTACELAYLTAHDVLELCAQHSCFFSGIRRMLNCHMSIVKAQIKKGESLDENALYMLKWKRLFKAAQDAEEQREVAARLSGVKFQDGNIVLCLPPHLEPVEDDVAEEEPEAGKANRRGGLQRKSSILSQSTVGHKGSFMDIMNMSLNHAVATKSLKSCCTIKMSDIHPIKHPKQIGAQPLLHSASSSSINSFAVASGAGVARMKSTRREIIRFIRVSWQGDPIVKFPVTTDTTPFSSEDGDAHAKVILGLVHAENRWGILPVVKFELIDLYDTSPAVHITGDVGGANHIELSPEQEGKGWRVIAIGSVPIAKIVASRSSMNHPGKSFQVTLDAVSCHETDTDYQITVASSIRRVLDKNSEWFGVLHRMRSSERSQFFQRKRLNRLDEMKSGMAIFISSIQTEKAKRKAEIIGNDFNHDLKQNIKDRQLVLSVSEAVDESIRAKLSKLESNILTSLKPSSPPAIGSPQSDGGSFKSVRFGGNMPPLRPPSPATSPAAYPIGTYPSAIAQRGPSEVVIREMITESEERTQKKLDEALKTLRDGVRQDIKIAMKAMFAGGAPDMELSSTPSQSYASASARRIAASPRDLGGITAPAFPHREHANGGAGGWDATGSPAPQQNGGGNPYQEHARSRGWRVGEAAIADTRNV